MEAAGLYCQWIEWLGSKGQNNRGREPVLSREDGIHSQRVEEYLQRERKACGRPLDFPQELMKMYLLVIDVVKPFHNLISNWNFEKKLYIIRTWCFLMKQIRLMNKTAPLNASLKYLFWFGLIISLICNLFSIRSFSKFYNLIIYIYTDL